MRRAILEGPANGSSWCPRNVTSSNLTRKLRVTVCLFDETTYAQSVRAFENVFSIFRTGVSSATFSIQQHIRAYFSVPDVISFKTRTAAADPGTFLQPVER